jgi:hypothetical protein
MAQVVEHLLCTCETLSSNPSPNKKEKRKPTISWAWSPTPVVPTTWEVEIRNIKASLHKKIHKTLSQIIKSWL